MSNNFKVKNGLEVANGITVHAGGLNVVGGGLTLPSELRIGTAADAVRFPNTVVAISNTAISTKPSELHNIGLLAEGTANNADTSVYGIGVYGIGYTAGATRSGGVVGEGHVSDTADTGSSIGVRGYALDTHIGGANIGLYGNAANGLTNYALYMSAGDIFSSTAQTWTLGGDLTFSGAHTVTIPTLGLTNALPVTSGGTGVSTSTGSGSVVLSDNATLVTPVLGNATATTLNKITLTQPANGSTITIADGKVLAVNNSLTFTGTDLSSVAFGAGGTVIYTTNKLSDLASTTSAELANTISDETGTGALVFANTPALTSPAVATSMTTASTSFDLLNTAATTVNFAGAATALSIGSATGTTTINNNLEVGGDITFGGGSTQLSASVINVEDPLIYMAENNPADILDIGLFAGYTEATIHKHTGIFRDASDKAWKLFSGITAEPVGNVLDLTGATYDDLQIGGLTATTGEFSSTVTGTQFISNIATGTAPFTVTSTTPVANLSIGGNAATVTTNANLTGAITSVGNATSVASQTGTGTKFVMDTSPVLVSPTLGDAVATTVNKLTLTQPATNAVLTLANGSSLITSGANSITLVSTGPTSITLPTSGTLVSSTVTSLPNLSTVDTVTAGTWSASFGAVSGANLTNLTAANLAGTIPSTVLSNSSLSIGTTSVALNRASGSLALTGITSIDGSAGGLTTATGSVSVSAAAAPIAGQALIATSPTAASWSTLSSINKVNVTAPTNSATLTLVDGSTLATSGANSITLVSTGPTSVTLPTSGTLLANTATVNIGTTSVALNRASASQTLTGISIDGAAGALATTGSPVIVSGAGTPTINQVLTATSGTAAEWRDISAILGSSAGTVTSVSGQGSVNGITLTGAVATSGYLTLGGTLSGIDLTTQVTNILPVANGGSGTSTATGTGSNVLGTSPAITTSLTTPSTSFALVNTTATTVNFAGAATTLTIGGSTGNTTVNNNLVVTGNFTVNGTNNIINTSSINVADSIISMASGNTLNSVDIGIFGLHSSSTTSKYTGLIRDASDGNTWKLFDDVTALPGTTVDFASATFAPLKVGVLTATKLNNITLTQVATGSTISLADNSTLTTAGNFTTSGAFPLTLTATASTNVTLPTTGTLLSSASTTFNKVTLTAPANAATISLANNSTLTTAGNFTTSGAYALTLTTTGATSVILPTSGTLISTSTINTVTGRVADSDGNLRSIPQSNKSAAYTLVAADNGKNINITTGGITIPSSTFSAGDVISIYNQSGTAQNISWSGPTVYVSGTSTAKTSPASLAARGILTIMFATATEIVISGNV